MIGDRLQDLMRNRTISPTPADPDAQPGADMGIIATALTSASLERQDIRDWIVGCVPVGREAARGDHSRRP